MVRGPTNWGGRGAGRGGRGGQQEFKWVVIVPSSLLPRPRLSALVHIMLWHRLEGAAAAATGCTAVRSRGCTWRRRSRGERQERSVCHFPRRRAGGDDVKDEDMSELAHPEQSKREPDDEEEAGPRSGCPCALPCPAQPSSSSCAVPSLRLLAAAPVSAARTGPPAHRLAFPITRLVFAHGSPRFAAPPAAAPPALEQVSQQAIGHVSGQKAFGKVIHPAPPRPPPALQRPL